MALFLKGSSLYSIFTQVPKTFNSTVALQVGFLKRHGDVAKFLLDSVCLSSFCFFMSFQLDWKTVRSDLCVKHWLCQTPCPYKNLTGLLQLMEMYM